MLIEHVRDRVEAEIAELAGRCQEAADLRRLLDSNGLPSAPLTLFLLPLGLRPLSEGDAAANAFTQMIDEVVGLLIVSQRPGDATGRRQVKTVDEIAARLMETFLGWTPDAECYDVFRLVRGALLPSPGPALFYQLDIATRWQFRRKD
jgi:hypothetical protein